VDSAEKEDDAVSVATPETARLRLGGTLKYRREEKMKAHPTLPRGGCPRGEGNSRSRGRTPGYLSQDSTQARQSPSSTLGEKIKRSLSDLERLPSSGVLRSARKGASRTSLKTKQRNSSTRKRHSLFDLKAGRATTSPPQKRLGERKKNHGRPNRFLENRPAEHAT